MNGQTTVPVPLPPLAGFIDALEPLPDDARADLWHRMALGELSAAGAVDEARRRVWPGLGEPKGVGE